MPKLLTFTTSALLVLAGLPAFAQTAATVNKTWVSSTGTDTGSCQLSAPCKTFAYAISETNAGGEIDVKDSGAYGPFTIAKAMTIVADGVVASVGGSGIAINPGPASPVVLRGLTINVHSTDHDDLAIAASAIVVLDHDIIQGARYGIKTEQAGAYDAYTIISNCLITGNNTGIYDDGNVYLNGNTISVKSYGVLHNFGHAFSYGNNVILGNDNLDATGLQPVTLK